MKKRIISLLLILTLLCTINISAEAKDLYTAQTFDYDSSELDVWIERANAMTEQTTIELDANDIHSTYRHIKIYWTKLNLVNGYRVQISTDKYFRDCVIDRIVTPKHQLSRQYYSGSIEDNINATYYIRVCGVFDYKINDKYYRMYGRWSEVIIAEGNE